jgi:hypothetical protein
LEEAESGQQLVYGVDEPLSVFDGVLGLRARRRCESIVGVFDLVTTPTHRPERREAPPELGNDGPFDRDVLAPSGGRDTCLLEGEGPGQLAPALVQPCVTSGASQHQLQPDVLPHPSQT